MGRKAAVARQIVQDVRADLTIRGVVIGAIATAAGLFLAVVIAKAMGMSLPWWILALSLVGAAFWRFGQWLKPGRYNSDAQFRD